MTVAVIGSTYPTPPYGHIDISAFLPHNTTKILLRGEGGFSRRVEECAIVLGIPSVVYPAPGELWSPDRESNYGRDLSLIDDADHIVVVWDGSHDGANRFLNYVWKRGKPLTLHLPRISAGAKAPNKPQKI